MRSDLTLHVRGVAVALWAMTAAVLLAGVAREIFVHFAGIETPLKDLRQLGLDTEHSLPAWYESVLMLVASVVLAILAAVDRGDRRDSRCWMVLATVFLLMAVDEVVAFHEVSIAPLRNAFHLGNYLYFSWVVLALPLLVGLALAFLPFLFRLPPATALRFVAAGGLFVGGAFGMELVGGHFASTVGFESMAYILSATIEESLETIGMTLFVISLLLHLKASVPAGITMRFRV